MIARLLIVLGAVLALPQIFDPTPWQAGFFGGIVLALAGAVAAVGR